MRTPLLALAFAALINAGAQAQTYPRRPVTILVAQAAGGVTDVVTRLYAQTVAQETGFAFVIENRPTGAGAIAASALQAAAPDGYTLYSLIAAQHASTAVLGEGARYDPINGNQPIMTLFTIPIVLAAPANGPLRSLADLVALSKTKPGGANVGSPGLGTPSHLSGAKLLAATQAPVTFVHFRGGAPMLNDLLPGRLDAAVLSPLTSKPHVEEGNLRILATDSRERLKIFPDAPRLVELGLGDATVPAWTGLAAPPGTPADIVNTIRAAFTKASQNPELQKRMDESGLTVTTSDPQQMRELLKQAVSDLESLLTSLGLKK